MVFWVNRAVTLFDQLIADGQTAGVFLEFGAMTLPSVIRRVLPIATFAAAVYATNRLISESELTVMQATGFSPWRLARPALLFGIISALMTAFLAHWLVPASLSEMAERERLIAENATSRLLTEGTFMHPADGVTFYIREISAEGVLRDVFLSDRRSDAQTITYTATEAYLLRDDSGPKLVMVEGMAQVYDQEEDRLVTTSFADFGYNIGSLIKEAGLGARVLDHISTVELLRDSARISGELDVGEGWVVEEGHARIAQSLFCILAALIGFSTLLLGGHSRFGVWRQVIIAFILLVALEILRSAVTDPVRSDAALWPILYLPSLLGAGLIVMMLGSSGVPLRSLLRRRTVA
jgi:lipopolysaccharide export system permease protein